MSDILHAGSDKKFSYMPEKPVPGSEITIIYNTNGTEFANSRDIKVLVYEYGINLIFLRKKQEFGRLNSMFPIQQKELFFNLPPVIKKIIMIKRGMLFISMIRMEISFPVLRRDWLL
jgi:hypothetical protein